MDDRISIPTSDSAEEQSSSAIRSWIPIVTGLSIILAVFVVTGDAEPVTTDTVGAGEIAPPPRVAATQQPPFDAFTFPGTGVVTTVNEVDGDLVAAVSGNVWGSSIWRLDADSGVWTLTDALPAITVLDAIALPSGMALAGFDRFDRTPALFLGATGAMVRIPIVLGIAEVPVRLGHEGGSLFVFTRFGDGSIGTPMSAYRVDADGGTYLLETPTGQIDDVFSAEDGSVVAVGSSDGAPAMWRVEPNGDLELIETEFGPGGERITAAARFPSGEAVGLVVGEFDTELPSTAVYRLEPPFGRLGEPLRGVWDRLVSAGAELLALPEGLVNLPVSGVTTYPTDSGVSWVAGTAEFAGPAGEGSGTGTIVISDAVVRTSGDLVVSGASSGQASFPVVASVAPVGDSADIPSARWTLADEVEPDREIVHLGEIHVALYQNVITIRDGFGVPWQQPVFADEDSVGGLVDLVELDTGFLLSATEPYPSLWFSSNGSAWQLIARDVLRVVGSDEAAIAVVGSPIEAEILGIDVDGLVSIAPEADPAVVTADRVGWIRSFGFVAGPVDGTVYVSDSGSEWNELELGVRVEAIQLGSDAVAFRTASGWFRFDGRRGAPILSPLDGESVRGRVGVANGGLLFFDAARAWVSTDFLEWTEVSFGVWEGADGDLVDLWVDETRVVALVDGISGRSLVRLDR